MKKAGEDILSYHKTVSLKIVQETETQEGHPAKIILPLYWIYKLQYIKV